MTKELYAELHSLITDSIGIYEDKREEMLDQMVGVKNFPEHEVFQRGAILAARYHAKIESLSCVLEQFEAEVEEPEEEEKKR